MDNLKELGHWDFPDTNWEPDGYDMTQVPKMSDRNFQILVDEHNKLVEVVNQMIEERKRT